MIAVNFANTGMVEHITHLVVAVLVRISVDCTEDGYLNINRNGPLVRMAGNRIPVCVATFISGLNFILPASFKKFLIPLGALYGTI